jgi:hypothetical protein
VCLVGRPNPENLTSTEFDVFVSPVSLSQPCPLRTEMPPQPCPVVKLKMSFSSRPGSPWPENPPRAPHLGRDQQGSIALRSISPHLLLYQTPPSPPQRTLPSPAPRAPRPLLHERPIPCSTSAAVPSSMSTAVPPSMPPPP